MNVPSPAAPAISQPPAAASGGWRRLRLGEWRLLALLGLVFILRDLPFRLEESGQADQAFTSLEMVRAGHWWYQHLPGGVVSAAKPPLAGWLSGALYYLTAGNWDLAWRLPSLLAALGLVALLWRAGEQLWPRWGGTLAASAFSFNFLTPRLAMLVSTEMLLTLEITLLGLVIWSHAQDGRPWSAGSRWLVFGLLLAALMTDGPVVYVFLLPGLLVHRWICRRLKFRPVPDAWGGWWHWVLPLLPYIFWLERGAVTVPGFYPQVVGHAFTGHLASGEAAGSQDKAIYFYPVQLLTLWAPWSLLFLAVRLRALRVWWRLCTQPGTLWLVCWAGSGLLCLSLFWAKPLDRIFPVLPPLCLLLTALLAAAWTPVAADSSPAAPPAEAGWPQAWSRWTLWLACFLTVVVTVAQVTLAYRHRDNLWVDFGARVRTMTEPARCELVLTGAPTANDAAMLVYLRRLAYLDPPQAIQLQSLNALDRIVVDTPSSRRAQRLLAQFDSSHPLLAASGAGGQFALLSSAEPGEPRRAAGAH
jgi:4-amino-4-deoxy-L-arabinose transferase-like glycosyltransferase